MLFQMIASSCRFVFYHIQLGVHCWKAIRVSAVKLTLPWSVSVMHTMLSFDDVRSLWIS